MDLRFDEIREESGGLPWVSGILIGVSYVFVTLSLTFIALLIDGFLTTGAPNADLKPIVYAFLWSFYGAHGVPVTGGSVELNLLELFAGGIPTAGYYLIPAFAMFMGGRSVARSSGHWDMSDRALGIMGSFVVLGYGSVLLVGSYVAEWNGVGPATTETILFAVLGFPIVFGFLGGYLAKR